MSRATKQKSVTKLINIVNKLLERQEKMMDHIGELEEYCEALEALAEFQGREEFISFIPDEEFQDILDEALSARQKTKLDEIKKKEEEPELFSIDEILKELEGDD